ILAIERALNSARPGSSPRALPFGRIGRSPRGGRRDRIPGHCLDLGGEHAPPGADPADAELAVADHRFHDLDGDVQPRRTLPDRDPFPPRRLHSIIRIHVHLLLTGANKKGRPAGSARDFPIRGSLSPSPIGPCSTPQASLPAIMTGESSLIPTAKLLTPGA